MYNLKVISLQGCPYSQNTESLLKKYNIQHNLQRINPNEKDKFKTNQISTFPQIYLVKNNQTRLLGGNNDLTEIISMIKAQKNINNMSESFKNKYPHFTKKLILRTLQTFLTNSKLS